MVTKLITHLQLTILSEISFNRRNEVKRLVSSFVEFVLIEIFYGAT